MLEGVETGYEEKFDFPLRDCPPDQVYVLASVPRSGSTYLSHLLWRTGCLGAPLEYLNFLPAGHYGFASSAPEKQIELWESVLHRRTSPNGVFGVKCFPMLIALLSRSNPELQSGPRSIGHWGNRGIWHPCKAPNHEVTDLRGGS